MRYAVSNLKRMGSGPFQAGDGNSGLLSSGNVVADFWAKGCLPCMEWKPVFEELAQDPSVDALLVTVDLATAKGIADQYAIEAVPTTLFLKDGRELARVEGAMTKEQFLAKAAQVYPKASPGAASAAPAPVTAPSSDGWKIAAGITAAVVGFALVLKAL